MCKTIMHILRVLLISGVVTGTGMLYAASCGMEDSLNYNDSEVADTGRQHRSPENPDVFHLYFLHENGVNLSAETVLPPSTNNRVARGRYIVERLISGPHSRLRRVLSEKTRLNAFYVTDDGVAYIDLSKNVSDGHPKGAAMEMLTIYSLVNSLVLNIPEINSVKILVNGRRALTLAGHIDIRYPFYPNMLLIR